MNSVTKNTLIAEAEQNAGMEASRRGLDKWDTESLVDDARAIVSDIFDNIFVEDSSSKVPEPVTHWRHRTPQDIETDWREMSFGRDEIRSAAERYADSPWLQSRILDWLILNVLTYAEFQATLDVVRARTMPATRYIASKTGSTKGTLASALWRGAIFILKWSIWFIAFAVSFEAAPYGPVAILATTGWWLWRRISARSKVNDILMSMQGTYAAFSSVSHSWTVIWEELKRSREKGAVWDGVVYRLVELRM